jgi:glucosamine--fructose-6-phosphate aminotransferase (isomerizing)
MTDHSERLRALTAEPSKDLAGDPHRLARVARTRAEMMAQGSAISATLSAEADAIGEVARMMRARPVRRVVVAGCGDSWHVGAGVAHAWQSLAGTPVIAAQALDYACYGAAVADAQTLVVGISSGGSTPAVLAALREARKTGALTLGISNTPGSLVLTECDAALRVHASRKGWPTQSSTATMALLIRLAQAFAGNAQAEALGAELDGIAPMLDALAPALDARMSAIACEVAAAPLLLFSGLGPNGAAAAFGAAKVKELSPIHAIAVPLEEYHHYRSQKAGEPIVLVATDPASHERALDTVLVAQAVGGWTLAVVAQDLPEIASRVQHTVQVPLVRPELAALVSTVALHLFAYHFAIARDALGLGAAGSPLKS